MKVEWAEECSYWKTSKSSPDVWFEKCIGLIEAAGGQVFESGIAREHGTERTAYMIRFTLDGETFKILWPALPSKAGDTFSSRRQAVTMLYHDLKARVVSAQVLGGRSAFFNFKQLPSGQTLAEMADADLQDSLPKLVASHQMRIEQEA